MNSLTARSVFIVSVRGCPPKAIFLSRGEAEKFIGLLEAKRAIPEDLKQYFPDEKMGSRTDLYWIAELEVADSAEQAITLMGEDS